MRSHHIHQRVVGSSEEYIDDAIVVRMLANNLVSLNPSREDFEELKKFWLEIFSGIELKNVK